MTKPGPGDEICIWLKTEEARELATAIKKAMDFLSHDFPSNQWSLLLGFQMLLQNKKPETGKVEPNEHE